MVFLEDFGPGSVLQEGKVEDLVVTGGDMEGGGVFWLKFLLCEILRVEVQHMKHVKCNISSILHFMYTDSRNYISCILHLVGSVNILQHFFCILQHLWYTTLVYCKISSIPFIYRNILCIVHTWPCIYMHTHAQQVTN